MAQDRRTAGHAAACKRAHARFKLCQIEWLGEVVVGARVEAAHAIAHRVEPGEDQHRQARLASAQALEDVETRSLRQTEVENQQVKRVGGESAIGLHAVFHPINRVPRLTKRVQNGVGQDRVVLRDEYPHASSSSPQCTKEKGPCGPLSLYFVTAEITCPCRPCRPCRACRGRGRRRPSSLPPAPQPSRRW